MHASVDSEDRRTSHPTLDVGLLLGALACTGAATTSAPLAAGVAALAVLLIGVLSRRQGARRRAGVALGSVGLSLRVGLLGASVFFVAAVRAQGVVDAFEHVRQTTERDGRWPALCSVRGKITRSPSSSGDSLRVVLDVESGRCEPGAVRGLVTLYVPAPPSEAPLPQLARGDEVEALARLAPLHRFWNDGTGDPAAPSARRGTLLSGTALDLRITRPGEGVTAFIDRLRADVRARIVATFPSSTEPMARALVLGDGDLPEADQDAFRQSGLSHLLAVSGMHLVLAVASVVAALRAALVRIPSLAVRVDVSRVAALLGVPLAWFYADFAGGSGSAVRAAWMMTAMFLARVVNRRGSPWRALGLSVAAMQLVHPLAVYDVSFVLSALATLGLLGLARPMVHFLAAYVPRWTHVVLTPFAATTSATLACAPVLAGMSPDLPLVGSLANLVAVPVGELAALPLCFVHLIARPWPVAEAGAALAASGALDLVRAIARVASNASFAALPVPLPTEAQLATAFATVAIAWLWPQRGRLLLCLGAASLVFLEAAQVAYGHPRGVLRITMLDVGQGDATLVDLPDGRAMLIDGGGFVGSPVDVGRRVIAPVLRARRRSAVDIVVLSHPHPDHFGGLKSGLEAVHVGEFWDTGQGEDEGVGGGYRALLDDLRARGIPVRRPGDLCGTLAVGGATIDVLAPCPGTRSTLGPNDNSFVFRIRHGERSALFVGDAEREEESELLAAHRDQLRADVLKVGHHGSRTSSSEAFLRAVDPRAALLSCGVRNRFGHPHPTTLRSLARVGIATFRTDRGGSVIVTSDGEHLEAQSLSMTPTYGKFLYFSAKSRP